MELIDKKQAMNHIESQYHQWGDHYDAYQIIADIEDMPAVDAVPVRHARLLNAHPYGDCSCCGALIDSRDRFRYCPYCGARLVGEGDKHGTD